MLETIVRVSSSKYSCVREALTAAAETDYVLPTNTVRTLGLKLLTCSQLHHMVVPTPPRICSLR